MWVSRSVLTARARILARRISACRMSCAAACAAEACGTSGPEASPLPTLVCRRQKQPNYFFATTAA